MKQGLTRRGFIAYFCAIMSAFAVFLCLTSCSFSSQSVDILSQKPVQEGKTQITVLIKHAFSINTFEAVVEENFPDIDIVQVGNYTTALSPDEYIARLKNDDLTDIVMTWPLSYGEEYFEDRLIDLAAFPFTTRYNVSMLDTISRSGKLYYLPGPAQVRGILYNKTLFEENGWEVPTDYDSFIALCDTINESGIRPIQLGFGNSEVLDTAFVGYSYADCFATPKDTQWIESYNQGYGNFLDQFSTALNTFQFMIDKGIWRKEDLQVDYSEREKLFFSRQCAMVEDSVLMTRMGYEISGSTDEMGLMPFFNPGGEGNDWARLYMVCYIGLNKHLEEEENKDKYEKVLKLMDYISSPQGQEALAGDTGAMYSSLKGVLPPNVPETFDIYSTLEHGRYAIFTEFPEIQDTLRQGLAGMVEGVLTKEDVGEMMDEANGNSSVQKEPEDVLGKAQKDFTLVDTGNFITDVMREYSGLEISLFLDGGKDGRYNNKGVTAKLYHGDLTPADIKRIMPDFKYGEKGELWNVTMTGENLRNTLEYSIPVDNNNTGWFYYFSGLKVQFDPTAEPGNRVGEVTLADNQKLNPKQVYTLSVIENSVPQEYLLSCEKTGILVGDILADSIRQKATISPSEDGRFILINNK